MKWTHLKRHSGKDKLSDSDCTQAEIFSRVVKIPKTLLGWMYLSAVRHTLAVIDPVQHDHRDRCKDAPTGTLGVKKERHVETSQKELKCSGGPAATIPLRQQSRPSASVRGGSQSP